MCYIIVIHSRSDLGRRRNWTWQISTSESANWPRAWPTRRPKDDDSRLTWRLYDRNWTTLWPPNRKPRTRRVELNRKSTDSPKNSAWNRRVTRTRRLSGDSWSPRWGKCPSDWNRRNLLGRRRADDWPTEFKPRYLSYARWIDSELILLLGICYNVMQCNVTDTISWQGHHDRVMQLNWLYFCGIWQMMPLKGGTIYQNLLEYIILSLTRQCRSSKHLFTWPTLSLIHLILTTNWERTSGRKPKIYIRK